jgi:hypothetical protein
VHLPDQFSVDEHQIRGDFEIAERLLLDGDLHSGWFNTAKVRIPATPASAKLARDEFWRHFHSTFVAILPLLGNENTLNILNLRHLPRLISSSKDYCNIT